MCEIAVVDPEHAGIEAIHQIAAIFNEEQGDGLGLLTIENNGDHFNYETYKSTKPHWQTIYSFLKRNIDDAWRIVIHGRAKTTGAVNRETAHPIAIDCEVCDFDYVIHNGHVKAHGTHRTRLHNEGHNFTTEVDTEVIAHEFSELPESVEGYDRNTTKLRGNLNYLLFSDGGILVRAGYRYDLSEEFTLTCSYNDFSDAEELGFGRGRNRRWALVTPGEDEPELEFESNAVRSGNASSNYRSGQTSKTGSARRGGWYGRNTGYNKDTVTIEYEDLATKFDKISAWEPVDGIVVVRDEHTEKDAVIRQLYEPRLYYFYSNTPTPENVDQLEQIAERRKDEGQVTLTDMVTDDDGNLILPDEDDGEVEMDEKVYEHVAKTVATEVDGVTIDDMAEVKGDLLAQ